MKRRLSLGFLEIFIIFIIGLFLLDLYIDYTEEYEREKSKYTLFFNQLSENVAAQLTHLFKSVDDLIEISKHLYSSNLLNFYDYNQTNHFYMPYMKSHPFITSINFGDEQGNGYLILNDNNNWKNRIKSAATPNKVSWVYLTNHGKTLRQEIITDNYDPRNRPWFKGACSFESNCWSNPYVFRTTRDVGITASCNISTDVSKKAVIGIDVMLKDLSRYLNNLSHNFNYVNINFVSENGEIFASSNENFADFLKKSDPTLPKIDDTNYKLLSIAMDTYSKTKNKLFTVETEDEKYLFSIKPLSLGVGNNLYITTSMSEKAFLKKFKKRTFTKAIYMWLFLLFSAIFFVKYYLLPLRKLTVAIKEVALGRFHNIAFLNRNDEVGVLFKEFNKMVIEIENQQQKICQSEKLYKQLFQLLPAPLIIFEPETLKILSVNESACKLYGYSHEEFLSLSLKDIEVKPLEMAKTKSKAIIAHKNKDGQEIMVEAYSDYIDWKGKKALLMLCVDVTEKLALQEHFMEKQRIETVGVLAGGVAHDFNNILTAIIGNATLLEMKLPVNDPLLKNVKEIIKASTRASKLTSELLSFGRKRFVNLKLQDLNEIINNYLPMMETITGDNISIDLFLSKTPLMLYADENQIGEVLINFTMNAKDALPEGGRITIITNKITISNTAIMEELPEGDYAVLTFSDTGIGMDEYTQKHIFDPFFTTKEVGKGTGLGLSAVYGIVKQHHGTIKLKSILNQGTSFYIYLPISHST